MFKISTMKIKGTERKCCKIHRKKTNRITNAGAGRQTAGVKRFRPSEEKVDRV
jgi:hypothetical protein